MIPTGLNTLLLRRADGSMGVLLTHLEETASQAEARTVARRFLSDPAKTTDAAATPMGPVVQWITENKTFADFRSGLVIPAKPSLEEFHALLLSALPLPPEVVL